MSISIYIASITDGVNMVKQLLTTEFNLNVINSELLAEGQVKPHFEKLKDTCYLLAETHYVDRVYRDSYYHYFSSKLTKYQRDCVRISIFEGEIDETDFRIAGKHDKLQEKYRGFIVLRPTEPFIVGRSIISPKALKVTEFSCCTTRFEITVNAIKLFIDGFPHSSQDTETISCAETTLWAVMEYFSNRYPDYKPLLPSKIIQTLTKVSSERQVPSKGLNIQQMSFALKEFGFGTRIYSKEEYGDEFEKLLSCYVESGIPLIIAMDNFPHGGDIGHALLCIGHNKISDVEIDALPLYIIPDPDLRAETIKKGIDIFDYSSIKKGFVFVDDNYPVYQTAELENPAGHYEAAWHNCRISYFIVPLYPKIYLEAYEAKNYILRFLITGPEPIAGNSQTVFRFYLASSRSYKNALAINDTFQDDLKNIILESSMSKFIWIAELSTKDLIKELPPQATGLIILDATEANISFNKPLILAAYDNKLISLNEKSAILESNILPLRPFSTFHNNLKNF